MPVVIQDKLDWTQHTVAIDDPGDCLTIKRRLVETTRLVDYGARQIYVHVPFCFFHCSFCVCKGSLLKSKSRTEDFLADLRAEVAAVGPAVAGHVFDSVFVGGGTVTVLDAPQLRQLLAEIRENFQLSAEAGEFSVELAPHGLTAQKLDVLVEMGVNRVTMGLQSLDPSLLSSWRRPVIPLARLKALVDAIHQRPFADANFDLMIDANGRTFDSLAADFDCLADWGCRSIMIYIDMQTYRDRARQQRVKVLRHMVDRLADQVKDAYLLNGGQGTNEYNRFISRQATASSVLARRYSTDYRSRDTFCLGLGRQAKSWTRDLVFHWH